MGGIGADPSTFKKGPFSYAHTHTAPIKCTFTWYGGGTGNFLGAVYAHLVIQFLDKHNPDVKCHGDFIQKPEQRK